MQTLTSATARIRFTQRDARSKNLLRCMVVLLGMAAGFMPGSSPALTVAWDPNPEADIACYVLSYGTESGQYSNMLDAGPSTSATVTGLTEGATYYFSVTAHNRDGLASDPSAEIIYQVPVPAPPTVIPQRGWLLKYVDSEETAGEDGGAVNAFDGDPSTFWHSQWTGSTPLPPHEIQIDLGGYYALQGFRYLARQDGWENGNIAGYEFYVSTDGITWGTPVASGTFQNTIKEQQVLVKTAAVRYVRLRSLSEINGGPWTTVAELNVLGIAALDPSQASAASFQSWAAAAGLLDNNAAPLVSPFNDGVVNLLKYAFALNGNRPDSRIMVPETGTAGLPWIGPVMDGNQRVLRFEYLRRKNGTLIYTPRKSSDLVRWQPLSGGAAVSINSVDNNFERVQISEPADPAQPVIFGRVQVELPGQ